jgi:hypothetical protein
MGSSPGIAQTEGAVLLDKRVTIKKSGVPLGDVFLDLGERYGVVFGLELSSYDLEHDDYDFSTNLPEQIPTNVGFPKRTRGSDRIEVSVYARPAFVAKKHTISVDFEDRRLEEVIDAVVEEMRNYSWELKDGVINIFPSKGRIPLFRSLLEIEVKKFDMATDPRVVEFKKEIAKLPEIQEFIEQNNLDISTHRSGLTQHLFRRVLGEFSFSHIQLRDLLNKVAKIKGGGWILRESRFRISDRKTIEVDI